MAEQTHACLCSEVVVSSFERFSDFFFFGLKMILMDKKLSVKAKQIKWVFEAFFKPICPLYT